MKKLTPLLAFVWASIVTSPVHSKTVSTGTTLIHRSSLSDLVPGDEFYALAYCCEAEQRIRDGEIDEALMYYKFALDSYHGYRSDCPPLLNKIVASIEYGVYLREIFRRKECESSLQSLN